MSAARLIFAAQAVRGLAYGLAAVQLATLLRAEGLQAAGVGLVLAAVMAGGALASIALARWGDRFGRRRSYAVLYLALALCGSLIAVGAPVWLLSLAALSGALSVEVVESGPFTTVEQVMLDGSGVAVRGFGLYNAVAATAGTAGALLGALPPSRSLLGAGLVAVGGGGGFRADRGPPPRRLAPGGGAPPGRPPP
ncbi:hypothetical protein ABZ297_46560, partial [Nonomuraea sp. NPDC005983]|uniref:hypothetical protein n=1 Tax=Nonomuraea sp. NPDC005983 TaxID=3155595 RepID=UPI0033B34AF7